MTSGPQHVSSRDNALLKELRRLAQDSHAYRKQGRVWLEGDHLCRAALQRGVQPALAVFQASYWDASGHDWALDGMRPVVIDDTLFATLSGLESPARMGFAVTLPPAPALAPTLASVVLDGVQDAGNVGAILRCASAFGFRQVLALKGTAGLWSPKVLRAGMGAHFGLQLIEGLDVADAAALAVPLLATSSHRGEWLHAAALPWPCAWAFGHEGQGVSAALMALARRSVRIAQPGGEESLNVATAAAVCLHASAASAVSAGGLNPEPKPRGTRPA
ncbi:RNA methyltransferase [Caenimonas sedimenti]|uniref:RNA methyltransferase n=1 Tax=Caenimonas sedimenti TaxID=2596921 RepID=A0A562ZTJ1_9BURK|nr:RNA methyltransferase [Caenimonas sedimenti]TWO71648.1 RNA methyltransferase [Caenimonas sedimenti]